MNRVLLLIESLGPGGAQVVVATLAAGLRSAGWHPVVCCWSQPGPLVTTLVTQGVEVHELGLRRASITNPVRFALDLARIIAALRRLVVRERVAVIHAHLQDSNFVAAVLGILTRRPAILTVHNVRLTPLERRAGTVRHALRSWAMRAAARGAYAVVAVGQQVAASLRLHVGRAARVRVIPNGITIPPRAAPDAVAATRARLGIGERDRVVISVGRLVPQKRHADIILALPTILSRVPEARLLLAGEGPELPALEALAARHGVRERVSFLGRRSDVSELLDASDVFVLPSAYEGLPLALVEAMAHAVPVVVSEAPGNTEVVTHGSTGLCVPVGAPERIAAAVTHLLDAPEDARRLAARGRALAIERYGAARMVDETARLYQEALEWVR